MEDEDEIEIQTPIYKLDIWYDKGRLGASGIIDGVFRNDTLDALFIDEGHVKTLTDRMRSFINQGILIGVPSKPIVLDDIDRTLLDRLIERLKKEVYFANEEDYIVWALWIAQTWLADLRFDSPTRIEYLFNVNVRLCIRAPIGHGKTVALNTLRRYSRKGIKSDKLTTAVAFRMAEGYGATLVLDEYQSMINKEDGLEDFVILGYDHDKKYQRAHKDDMGTDAYNASVPVAYSMKTSRSKEDSISRGLEFIIPKAPNTFEPYLIPTSFTQEMYRLRVWAQQPGNLAKLMSIKDGLKQFLKKEGIFSREKDNVIGLCVIAKLFGKEDWLEAILKKSKAATQSLQENLATSIDGFILDAIEILTDGQPFESKIPLLLSDMRELASNDQNLNTDNFTIDKIRNDKGYLTRNIKNHGFIIRESKIGTRRDYRIDFGEKASREAYNKLRKAVRGESEPQVQSIFEIPVNRPSEYYGLTDEGFKEMEKLLTEAQVSDKGVRDRFPEIKLHKLVNEGIIKIDEREIVHLKRNRPKGNVLELGDCM